MNQEHQDRLYTVARRWTIAFMVIGIIGILANLFLLSKADLVAAMKIVPIPTMVVIAIVVLLVVATFYHYRNIEILNRQELPLSLPWYLNFAIYFLSIFYDGLRLGKTLGIVLCVLGYRAIKKVRDLKTNQH